MTRRSPPRSPSADELADWTRVGSYVGERCRAIGISTFEIGAALAISAAEIEAVVEGRGPLVPEHAYAWADVLELRRDVFLRFVRGEAGRSELPATAPPSSAAELTPAELALVTGFRALGETDQAKLVERLEELRMLARVRTLSGPRRQLDHEH